MPKPVPTGGSFQADDGSRIEVHSETVDDLLQAEIRGVLAAPFSDVAETLSAPGNWCEIAPLALNIKACTRQKEGGEIVLTFYAGRKTYQPPEKAYRIDYRFHLAENDPDRLWLFLFAADGPMGTSDYHIELEATPAGSKTRLRISSSYRSSLLSRMAVSAYLATLGRNKVGFSLEQGTPGKEPTPIGGIRGVVERNAMRYYLALRAFLQHRHLAGPERFAACTDTWYDLTEKYARQLHELEKDEYLAAKHLERQNQLELQQCLDGTEILARTASASAVD